MGKTAKKAAAKTAEPKAVAAAPAEIRRERIEVGAGQLVAAPWNPRGEISPESVADLVASIRAVGMIEPVVAMESEGGNYIIIAGHRRVKAAELAGIDKVPCDVLRGIDATVAKRMTFIENLQRRDADPILESNLVSELIADGMSTDEIAAEIGRDRKWVLRRANLAKLSPSWRKRVAGGEKITTDCLEHVAAYPATIQEKLKRQSAYNLADGVLHWDDIRRNFEYESRDLKMANFDCSRCYGCVSNSGCTPDLFDWDGGKLPELGHCLDAACYKRRSAKHAAETVAAAKSSGHAVVNQDPTYTGKKTSATMTSKCNTLYTWEDYDKNQHVVWGEAPSRGSVSDGGSLKLSKRQLAARRRMREVNKAIRKLVAACIQDDTLAGWLYDRFPVPMAPFLISFAFHGLSCSWRFCGVKSTAEEMALAAMGGNLEPPPAHWYTNVAAEICRQMDPKNGAFNAQLVLVLFPEARTKLTDEECGLIIEAGRVDTFLAREIEWNAAPRSGAGKGDDDGASA